MIEDVVVIDRDPAEVFAAMTDPWRELDWNPQLLAVEQLTDRPAGVGARLRMRVRHGLGDGTVACTGADPPRVWGRFSGSLIGPPPRPAACVPRPDRLP